MPFSRPQASSGPENPGGGDWDETLHGVSTKPRTGTRTMTPALYQVIIHNDDFTPREFVVHVLQRFFSKDEPAATQLMLQIHHRGAGVAGVFTHEIAETKAYQVNDHARKSHYPLRTTVERA